ncbi:transglycosylase SLT domain-containing protein [Nocardia sp. NPDC057440]|uniref:transglycosylase SLT domain-containing protein n=1 Tax=Nocardia sp. NPDC057440 TaxID=3346134 RepID=UPI00366B5241
MATITRLKFDIDSKYNPAGINAARADIRAFNEELRRMSNKAVKVKVETEVDPDFGTDFQARLNAIAITRNYHITLPVDLDEAHARAALEEFARERRRVTVNVDADTAAARANIDTAARNRQAHIDVDTDLGIMRLVQLTRASRYAAIGVAGVAAAFYLIGPAAAVAGAAVMTAMTGGVIAAGIAAIVINDKLTASHQKATTAALRQADSAKTALGNAYTNVTQVAADGAARITQAEKQVEQATRSSKQARDALTEAYRSAGREYEDMVLKLKGAPIDERGAVLAIERARQRLRELGKNGESFNWIDVAEAQNNVDQAIQSLEEIRVRNRRLAEDFVDSDEKGIEGSKKVVDAKQNIIDAEDREKDSITALTKARNDAAEANRRAAEEVTQAQMRVAEAQEAVNEALKKQNGLAAQAAKFFSDMAAPMRGELAAAMDKIRAKMNDLAPLLQDTFRNATPLVQPYADSLLRLTENVLPGMNNGIKKSQPIVLGFSDGLATFGTRLGNMFDLMGDGAEGLGNTWRVVGDEVGRWFELIGGGAARMSQTGSESLRLFLGGLNNLWAGMIDGAAPAMEAMAGRTSILNSIFSELGNFFRIAGPAIGQFTEAISGALDPAIRAIAPALASVLGAFLQSITPIIIAVTPAIVAISNGFATLVQQLNPIMPVLGPVIAGVWALNVALAANPIGLVVVAVAALAGGITYLATKTQFFQNMWANFAPDGMKNFFKAGEDGTSGFSRALDTVVGWGKKLWELFGPSISRIGDALKGAWSAITEQWNNSLRPALEQLGEKIGPLLEVLKPIGAVIGGIILALVNSILGIVEHLIKPVVNFVMEFVTAIINAISSLIQFITGFIGGLMKMIEIVVAAGKVLFEFVDGIFTGDFSGLWESLRNLGSKIVELITGPLKTMGEGILGIVNALWDAVFAIFRGVFGVIHGIVRGFIQGIIGFFQWLFDVLVGHSIVPDLIDKIHELFMWLPRKVIALVQGLVEGVVKLWDFLKNKWESYLDGIKVILENVSTIIQAIWEKFWNKVKEIGTSIWDSIKSAFTNFSEGVKSTLEGVVHIAENVWNGIKGIFARPINAVIGFWNDTIADKIGLGDKKIPVIPGYRDGGPISGAGGGRQDAINANLSHGEYVVNARAAFLNRRILDRMNFGGEVVPAYADGGPVEWMKGWVSQNHPAMQVTSDYRDSNDYHGIGRAVDFAASMQEMMSTATDIASTWGKNSLELIHGNGFQHNIKDGRDVGDGMSVYKPGTMAEHNNHLHWAVDKALGEDDAGQGFFGRIGDAVSGVVSGARELVSGLFSRFTDPLLSKIPDPFAGGMGGPMGSMPKGAATKVRDNIADLIRGKESTAGGVGDIGGVVPDGDRLRIIDEALKITNTPPPETLDAWRRGLNTLIGRESGWNAGAVNDWDVNARNGVPSKGLAQVIPPTFQTHKVPGYDNILDPVSNVAASVNYIKARYGTISKVQQANENLPPQGYADGTDYAKPGWNLVGENGPEMVKFRGGEEVHSFDEIIERIKSVNVEGRTQQAVQGAVKSTLDTFMSDLTGGSVGDGFLGQLLQQSVDYGGKLANWSASKGDTHYHVSSAEELIRLEKQKRREQSIGFD